MPTISGAYTAELQDRRAAEQFPGVEVATLHFLKTAPRCLGGDKTHVAHLIPMEGIRPYMRAFRLQGGRTQVEVAATAKVTQPTIASHESGTNFLDLAAADKLYKAAGGKVVHLALTSPESPDQTAILPLCTYARAVGQYFAAERIRRGLTMKQVRMTLGRAGDQTVRSFERAYCIKNKRLPSIAMYLGLFDISLQYCALPGAGYENNG